MALNPPNTYETFADAVIAAKHRAKAIGFAYAVEWPLGHCTCVPA